MDIKELVIPGMIVIALGGSYVFGRLFGVPAWLSGILAAALPMLLFCIALPGKDWSAGMQVVGGYVIFLCVALGAACYALTKSAGRARKRDKEYIRTRPRIY